MQSRLARTGFGFWCLTLVGCGQVEWKEIASEEGDFTVHMPGTPKKGMKKEGSREGFFYSSDLRAQTFMISYIDLEPKTKFTYDLALVNLVKARRGKVSSKADWTLGSALGISYQMETAKPKGNATGRMVVVNNRLYKLIALGADCTADNADVQKFLDSFKLIQ